MTVKLLDAQRLQCVVRYFPETGKFVWRRRSVEDFRSERDAKIWNTRYAGQPAFTTQVNGYYHGRVDGRRYLAHRLAWVFVHGAFPSDEIDHVNGDRADNRISNLRDVSRAENARNLKRFEGNQSGVTGVSLWPKTGRWRATICQGGKQFHLGTFDLLSDAKAARLAAECRLGFHANHGRAS